MGSPFEFTKFNSVPVFIANRVCLTDPVFSFERNRIGIWIPDSGTQLRAFVGVSHHVIHMSGGLPERRAIVCHSHKCVKFTL